MRKFIIILGSLLLLAGLAAIPATGAAASPSAHAVSAVHAGVTPLISTGWNNWCDASDGECLSAKSCGTGHGTEIVEWYYQGTCNPVEPQTVNLCSGGDEVTSTCPFAVGSGMNNLELGKTIFQVNVSSDGSDHSAGCIGNDGSGNLASVAAIETCNNSSGSGGSDGTIFVYGSDPQLGGPSWISRYWSDTDYTEGYGYGAPSIQELCGAGANNYPFTLVGQGSSLCEIYLN